MSKIRRCRASSPPHFGLVPRGIRGKGRLSQEFCWTDRARGTEPNRGHAGATRAGLSLQGEQPVFRSGSIGCLSGPKALAWRGHEPPEAVAGSGGRKWRAAGGPQSRGRFGRAGGRFDPRASRRLCRTLGLPESRKSPPKWIVFVRCRSRGPVHPDPAAGFFSRSPRRKNLSLAGVEIRSRVACPIPARVGRCARKSSDKEMAEREGFEPPSRLRGIRFSRPAR